MTALPLLADHDTIEEYLDAYLAWARAEGLEPPPPHPTSATQFLVTPASRPAPAQRPVPAPISREEFEAQRPRRADLLRAARFARGWRVGVHCHELTKDGKPCMNPARRDGFCHLHQPDTIAA